MATRITATTSKPLNKSPAVSRVITGKIPHPVETAKIHLAAAHRLAALHDLEEGIDNHFTVTMPGKPDQFLILPFGVHWSEAKASDMMVFNEAGKVISGRGPVELSARCIHAPIHRITGTQVVLHCPVDDGLQTDWFNRADAFSSLFERCLERWGELPAFVIPTEKDGAATQRLTALSQPAIAP